MRRDSGFGDSGIRGFGTHFFPSPASGGSCRRRKGALVILILIGHKATREKILLGTVPSTSPAGAGYAQGERCEAGKRFQASQVASSAKPNTLN